MRVSNLDSRLLSCGFAGTDANSSLVVQLLTRDTTLAIAMSSVCPSTEVDELTISLLNIFEKRGRSFILIEALIKQEIEDTGHGQPLLEFQKTPLVTVG